MPNPKWRRNPQLRPRQIAEAALEVFGDAGVERATIDQIAAKAGVAKGTVYLYFPNKQELFRQSIRDALAASLSTVSSGTEASPTNRLQATMVEYWRFLRSPSVERVHRLVLGEQKDFPDLVDLYTAAVTGPIEADLRKILEAGIGSGEFREMDPGTAARMLTAAAIQSSIWASQGRSPLPAKNSDAGFSDMIEFYLQGIVSIDAGFAQADGAPTLRGALNS